MNDQTVHVAKTLRHVHAMHKEKIEQVKSASVAWGQHRDWPWNGLVLSGATRGGSARWEKNVQPRYSAELAWAPISGVSEEERRRRLETVGRFWRKTADWLGSAYQFVSDAGGPPQVRAHIRSLDRDGVLEFWLRLEGVGPKYARNIMMDIYDDRFRDCCFAIDSRISGLLPLLGYDGPRRFDAQEAFLMELANNIGIEAWELDRLLYTAHRDVQKILKP